MPIFKPILGPKNFDNFYLKIGLIKILNCDSWVGSLEVNSRILEPIFLNLRQNSRFLIECRLFWDTIIIASVLPLERPIRSTLGPKNALFVKL